MRKSSKFGFSIPYEVKLVAIILVSLGALLLYDFAFDPDNTTKKLTEVTGSVIEEVQAVVKEDPIPAPAPIISELKINEPSVEVAQSAPFVVSASMPTGAHICYYQVRDSGSVKWDRRSLDCSGVVTILPNWCNTPGEGTCMVHMAADDRSNKNLGQDTVYFTIS